MLYNDCLVSIYLMNKRILFLSMVLMKFIMYRSYIWFEPHINDQTELTDPLVLAHNALILIFNQVSYRLI